MADTGKPTAPQTPADVQPLPLDQTIPGGHYIVDGRHVDANGNELNDDGSSKKDSK